MAGGLTASLTAKATCAIIISIVLLTLGTTQAAPSSGHDLWTNPCSSQPSILRHTRSASDQELNTFINSLNKGLFKRLKALYPKDLKKVKGNCPRLNKLIEPIENAPNLTSAHEGFYQSMIEIAGFLDKLKNMPIKTDTQFNLKKRRAIYEETENALKLTICEFNETILKESKAPHIFLQNKPRMKIKCLPKEAYLGQVQMLDMQFFQKLRRFLKQGKKILKRKKKNSRSENKAKKHAQKRTSS